LLFLGHNFLTTNARKAIKDSEDANFRLVFFKGANISLCGWGSGSNEKSQNDLNLPLLWRNPHKLKSKTSQYF